MKYLLFILALSASGIKTSAQQPVADSLATGIFKALKNKDTQAFLQLFPTRLQMKQLVTAVFPKEESENISEAEMGLDSDSAYQRLVYAEFLKPFYQVLKQGDAEGLQWSRITLTDLRIDTIWPTLKSPMTAYGALYFNDGKTSYRLDFNDAVWSDIHKGWFGVILQPMEALVKEEEKCK